MTQQVVAHLDAHYAKVKAFAAAAQGVDALLKAALPPSSRLVALRAAARYHTELALKQLADDVAAGGPPAEPGGGRPLPKPLADVLAVLETIDKEFPADPAWRDQSALAERVRQLAAAVAPPAKAGELKAPDALGGGDRPAGGQGRRRPGGGGAGGRGGDAGHQRRGGVRHGPAAPPRRWRSTAGCSPPSLPTTRTGSAVSWRRSGC